MKWITDKQLERLKDEHGRTPPILNDQNPAFEFETIILEHGAFEDVPYECKQYRNQTDQNVILVITLLQKTPCRFTVLRKTPEKNSYPLWFKLLGLTPVPIRDNKFDAEFAVTIQSHREETLERVSRFECKQVITDLAAMGFTGIRKDALGIDIFWLNYPHDKQLDTQVRDVALTHLKQLNSFFHDAPPEPAYDPGQSCVSSRSMCFIIMSLPILYGGLYLLETGDNYNPVSSGLLRIALTAIIPAGILLIPFILVERWLNRGVTVSRIKKWLTRIFPAMACFVTGIGVTMWANGEFDKSEPRTHVKKIIALDESGRCVDVESWHDENETVRVPISYDDADIIYDTFEDIGSYPPLHIVTKSGFLGIEWLVRQGVFPDSLSSP